VRIPRWAVAVSNPMPANPGSRADGYRCCRAAPPLTAITLGARDHEDVVVPIGTAVQS
jgi:hypothetical protein